MRRHRTHGKVQVASDIARQQLGWYMRNCALSPAYGLLERLMLTRLDRLKGEQDGDPDEIEFDMDASFNARDLSRRRRELRHVLKKYDAIVPFDDGTELNAFFARDEFGLDEIDTEILLLLLRYERNSDLEQFADEVLQRLHAPARAVAAVLGVDWREVRNRIAAGSPLITTGLICISEDGCYSGLGGSQAISNSPGLCARSYNARMLRARNGLQRSSASRWQLISSGKTSSILEHLATWLRNS